MKKKSILIIDSDIMTHRIIKGIVYNWNCSVFNAYNANEAINILYRVTPDVIILEQYLPDMYGTDFLGVIRSRNINSTIIILTNFLTEDIIPLFKQFNVFQAFQKPVDNNIIQQCIINAFNCLNPTGMIPVEQSGRMRTKPKGPAKEFSTRPPATAITKKKVENPRKKAKLALRKRIQEEKAEARQNESPENESIRNEGKSEVIEKDEHLSDSLNKIQRKKSPPNKKLNPQLISELNPVGIDPDQYEPYQEEDHKVKYELNPEEKSASSLESGEYDKKEFKKISNRIERVLGDIEKGMLNLEDECSNLDSESLMEIQELFEDFMTAHEIKFDSPESVEDFLSSNSIIEKVDSSYQFRISDDSMRVSMTLFPPSGGGRILEANEIIEALHKIGVNYGICLIEIQKAVARICSGDLKPYKTVVAEGEPSINATDDRIIMHKRFVPADKKSSEGKVDYKNISNVCMVKPGDLLVEIIRGLPGKKGINIYGREVPFNPGKKVLLNPGENIRLSDDGLKYFAAIEGNMKIINNTIKVVDYYLVDGDVDYSVGNISYKGNVYVKGNVLDEFIIKAAGDVIITGNVNAAYIYAAGDITILGGVVARNKGLISANGKVNVKFAEHAEIEASGDIIIENSSVFSNLYSNSRIFVRSGRVVGGNIYAREYVNVDGSLGSDQTKTYIHVGSDFLHERQSEKMQKDIKNWKEKMLSLKQLMVSVKSKSFSVESLPKEEQLKVFGVFKAHKKIENIVLTLNEKVEQLNSVNVKESFNKESFIQSRGKISQDTMVYFGNMKFFLRKEYQNTRLKYNSQAGEIEPSGYSEEKINFNSKIKIPEN